MQIHDLLQGSPEWHAHRASHFNASDAPAIDYMCAMTLAFGIASGLLRRARTGRGGEVGERQRPHLLGAVAPETR